MKKESKILAVLLSAIMATGVFSSCDSDGGVVKKDEDIAMSEKIEDTASSTDETKNAEKEVPEYKDVYVKYLEDSIRKHGNEGGDFSRGMLLCDLNEDGVPELFSISYDNGEEMRFHEFKNGKVLEPAANTPSTKIDVELVIRPQTYFEESLTFMGVYRNKMTGKLALINSVADGSENDRFDIITYDGTQLNVEDKGAKEMVGYGWNLEGIRAEVMKDYEYVEDGWEGNVLLRGMYSMYQLDVALDAMEELIKDFKTDDREDYENAKDGVLECYVRNVDLKNRELELIPVTKISHQDYSKAINGDGMIEIDGETMSVERLEEADSGVMHQMPWFEYYFEEPTETYPESVVKDYRGKTPVKTKISENIKFINQATGKEVVMDIDEFFTNYAVNYNGNYYSARISNGEVVELALVYTP